MAYWLFKSEPGAWSWDDQVAAGSTAWDGVRNFQACNNMKAMALGDKGFFYHSGDERRIMGVVAVSQTFHPDPKDPTGRFGMVAVKTLRPVKRPVTLADIKAEPRLAAMALVRQSRLSVSPVGGDEWRIVCRMAGVEP